MKKILTLVIVILIGVSLSGCNRTETDDRPVVYVTVYPVGFLVEEISEGTINVQRVPGSNTHSDGFSFTPKQVISMKNSVYIFYVGANLDNYIPDNEVELFSSGSVELVHIGEYIEFAQVCYDSHSHSHDEEDHVEETEEDHVEEPLVCDEMQLSDDPHFWLDPKRMIEVAALVRDKLTEEFPDNALMYSTNYANLVSELQQLDTSYQDMANNATKPIITTNMLFNYWTDSYGLEIFSLTPDAHNDNTIPSDIIGFRDEAVFHEIHYILFETNANSPAGEAVLSELVKIDNTADKAYLHGLASLTQEELDAQEDYLSLMYKNLVVLIEATKPDTE